MFRIWFILLLSGLLTACMSPLRIGVSEAEWRNYSPEEKQKIKSGYYQVLRGRFHPIEEAVDGSHLQVKISDGQIGMPPFTAPCNYVPVSFTIANGEGKTVQIYEAGGNKKVAMQVSYRGKTLYLDPSRYDLTKKLGSIQLHYSPIWDRGFSYQKVSSSGYAHLVNVNVFVKRDSGDNSISDFDP